MKNTKRGCSTCGGNQPTKRIVESFEGFVSKNINNPKKYKVNEMVIRSKGVYDIYEYEDVSKYLGVDENGKPNLVMLWDKSTIEVNELMDYWMEYKYQDIPLEDFPIRIREILSSFVESGGYYDIIEYILENLIGVNCSYRYTEDTQWKEECLQVTVFDS
jgi:hypothetical protein